MEDPLRIANSAKITHCRMCAKQKNYAELLDLSADVKTFAEYIDIVDYLQLDFLDLSKECLPKTTCEKCYDSFQEAYNFFKKLHENQHILKNLYRCNVNIKIEPTENNKNLELKKCEKSADESSDSEQNLVIAENMLSITEEPEISTEKPQISIEKPQISIEKTQMSTEKTQISTENTTPKLLELLTSPLQLAHCRFCADKIKKSELINLSDNKDKLDDCLSMLYFFKINVTIIGSMLPTGVCQACFSTLKKMHTYFKAVKRNQNVLNNIYNAKLENLVKIKVEPGYEDVGQEMPLSLCDVVILNNDTWSTYPWVCKYCEVVFTRIEQLRTHSKEQHNMCHAFICVDCKQTFDLFTEFVDHVHQHRESLRLFCHYCYAIFESTEECAKHVDTHNASTQKICNLCGEIFPYQSSLKYHQKLYGKKVSDGSGSSTELSWSTYDWTCLDCYLRFPDITSLRTHIQTSHDKCFAMKCMDCSVDTKNFKLFVAHVITHRPYLKNFCQYCNTKFHDRDQLNQHIVRHITSQQRPCNMCGQIFDNNTILAKHKKTFVEKKKLKNSTVNTKKTPQEDKPKQRRIRKKVYYSPEELTCKVCSKICDDMIKYRRHIITHDQSRPKGYVCQICGKGFYSSSSLKDHVKHHTGKKNEVCQMCKKTFFTRHQLKEHIITHSEEKPFICNECGQSFKTKRRLNCHMYRHSDEKRFKCSYCYKEFKFKENLKTHEYQHTGLRPYSCEYCERTFTNWANCNKHMIRKHGVTLARTKITEHGRMAIDRTTGEANTIAKDTNTKQWFHEMLKPDRPGKKPSK